MSVIDGSSLNGELLRFSSCKLVKPDAITLTLDTGASITVLHSSLSRQNETMNVFIFPFFFL